HQPNPRQAKNPNSKHCQARKFFFRTTTASKPRCSFHTGPSVHFRAGRSETSIPLDWFQRDPAVTAERHTTNPSPFL
ncbi:hypothetical protein B0H12DRAFT_1125490, partial [Mycena haematopus]